MVKITRVSIDEEARQPPRRLHLREISVDPDAPLENVGHDFRTARQRLGHELAIVSQALKIRKDHLMALEEGHFDALPGRVYALGFVRSYAEYLGLDSAKFVERYKAEIKGLGEPEPPLGRRPSEGQRVLPPGTLILAVLLLLAAAYGGYYLSVSAQRMLSEPVATVPERFANEIGSGQGLVPVEARAPIPAHADPGSEVVSDRGVPLADAPNAESPPQLTTSAMPAPADALPSGRTFGTRNVGSRITLRIHLPARVLVQGEDNTVFLNRPLRPGDLYQVPDIVGLTVTTPDSGAVELILDGASLGYIGARDVIAEGLSLDPQDLVERAQGAAG